MANLPVKGTPLRNVTQTDGSVYPDVCRLPPWGEGGENPRREGLDLGEERGK